MSVPKSERRQSDVEYIVLLQKIEEFFIAQNTSDNRVEKLSDELVNLSMQAYNYGTMYFELCNGVILGTLAQKKKYCKCIFWTSRQLASQINIMIAFRMQMNKPCKELVKKTEELLKVCNLIRSQLTKLNHTQQEK